MLNITDNLPTYRQQIESFLGKLNSEKAYFNLTIERVMNWELVMVEMLNDEITAIAGLERKLGIVRNNLVIKKEFHGKGLGKSLLRELLSESKMKHNLVWGVISEKNIVAIKNDLATGHKIVGNRQGMCYLIAPLNWKGKLLYYLIRALFPTTKLLDIIRR
jgi:GNAT superfamily N-acetyltransferase